MAFFAKAVGNQTFTFAMAPVVGNQRGVTVLQEQGTDVHHVVARCANAVQHDDGAASRSLRHIVPGAEARAIGGGDFDVFTGLVSHAGADEGDRIACGVHGPFGCDGSRGEDAHDGESGNRQRNENNSFHLPYVRINIAQIFLFALPMRHYIELTKPRITWLILMSTGVGYYFGVKHQWGSMADWALLLHTMVGTGLIASGTAALNQWYERHSDGLMRRTAGRPLPMGRMQPGRAMWFGIALAAAGFIELAWGVNLLSALLGAFTMGAYLFLYTPLKQRSHLSTVVGALPGALPPLMGYAASFGGLNAEALTLFLILFVWQFPHFLAIAWMYREDYARAGILMLPVVEPDGSSTARQIVLYASTLIPISLLPVLLRMSGKIYLVGALALGTWFLYTGVRVAFDRTNARARSVLLASVIYLPLIYVLMVFDRPGL